MSSSRTKGTSWWMDAVTDRRRLLRELVGVSVGAGIVGASRATSARAAQATPGAAGTLGERLIHEAPGMTDQFGRIPLSRLSFDARGELPIGILVGPLVAIVESGEFEVEAATAGFVGPGDRLVVGPGIAVSARNTTDDPGSWLALILVTEEDRDAATAQFEAQIYSNLTPEMVPTDIEHRLLTRRQNIRSRLYPARFTLETVVLAPGAGLESLDLGGPTPVVGIGVIVERGRIRLTGKPNWDPLVTGEDTQFEADDDSGVQAVGDEPALLLVVRMGEDDAAD